MKGIHRLPKLRGLIKLFLLNVLTGLLSFSFLYLINRVVAALTDGHMAKPNPSYIAIYTLIVVCFVLSRRLLAQYIVVLTQNMFWGLRKDILRMVLRLDYEKFVRQKEKVLTAISGDVYVLTQAYMSLVYFVISVLTVAGCCVYMAFISLPLFLFTAVCIAGGAVLYWSRWYKYQLLFEKSRALDTLFMKYVNHILDGFKEILVDNRKGSAILQDKIVPLAEESMKYRKISLVGLMNNQVIGQLLLYSLIGLILLYFDFLWHISFSRVVSYIFVLLYMRGELENIMITLPTILEARASSRNLDEIKAGLSGHDPEAAPGPPIRSFDNFDEIRLENVLFDYSSPTASAFKIGPVNLTIGSGEIIFLYGGNGSGKTTLMITLLGLLKMHSGKILVDGQPLLPEEHANFLELFSVVFADYFLFDELHGLENFDRERLLFYLELFEIDKKVGVVGRTFTTTDLSAGQRKRLALIAALIENRKLLLLDEWAADQDPLFREKFYKKILPILKADGFTIFAITHDDRYYTCADKVYYMEYGRLFRHNEMQERHFNPITN